MIKDIIILGGGTSGLVAALILKSRNHHYNIKVIKSNEIGIIGVGEGSTEHWTSFINICGISVNDLVLKTDATFKTGIKFVNWNGDQKYFFHSLHTFFVTENQNLLPHVYLQLITDGLTANEIVPKNIHESTHTEHYETTVNQFHFNTFKLNQFLLDECKLRNIDIIDSTIQDVILDENGYVKSLVSNSNQIYHAEFFVDCSGMRRVIASKLGAKWLDMRDHLPMNSAIAFPTERQEEIPSNTSSTAMSSGWMWRIPTQERFGNGYVYCDDFITEDKAIEEAQSIFDHPIEIAKKIKFSAGYVDKFWIKNCVSLGLSGSFVEPLEASSIGTSIQQSIALASHLQHYYYGNTYTEKLYNKEFEEVAKNIIDFVQLHYITKRNDTNFWKYCQSLKLTDFNKETLESFKKYLPNHMAFGKPFLLFRDQNWLQVMHGLELLDTDQIKKIFKGLNEDTKFSARDSVINYRKWESERIFIPHREALEIIKSRQPFTKIEMSIDK